MLLMMNFQKFLSRFPGKLISGSNYGMGLIHIDILIRKGYLYSSNFLIFLKNTVIK